MRVSLEHIIVDFALQPRTGLKRASVSEFADRMLAGDIFPPVLLFRISEKLYLVDGFHRYYAAQSIQSLDIEAQIQEATYREALLISIESNRKHGIRFSNADKRKAVFRLLKDSEWSEWSDNKIADYCGVSQPFVSSLRAELQGDKTLEQKERSAQKEGKGANKSRDLEAENKKLRKQIERLKAELEKARLEAHNLRIELMKERRKGSA